VIKLKRIRWAGQAARIVGWEMRIRFWWESLKGGDHLGHIDVHGITIYSRDLNRMWGCDLHPDRCKWSQAAGSCKHCNKLCSCIKWGTFRDRPSDYCPRGSTLLMSDNLFAKSDKFRSEKLKNIIVRNSSEFYHIIQLILWNREIPKYQCMKYTSKRY
jgi:hypothetical protein